MKKFFSEFKTFATKGNVVDMAVAVIVGGAFGKIVTSLVNDIVMPLIALIVGGKSVSSWKWVIEEAVYENGVLIHAENALRYGIFLQAIIDFLIIAFCIFLALKIFMKAKAGLNTLENDFKSTNAKERKEYIAKLKAEKKTKKQIKELLIAYETELKAKEQAEAAAKKAAEDAAKPETQEKILSDIRALLSEKAENNK